MYLQSPKSVQHNAANSVNQDNFKEKPTYRVWCLYSSFVHGPLPLSVYSALRYTNYCCEEIKQTSLSRLLYKPHYSLVVNVDNSCGAFENKIMLVYSREATLFTLHASSPFSTISRKTNLYKHMFHYL